MQLDNSKGIIFSLWQSHCKHSKFLVIGPVFFAPQQKISVSSGSMGHSLSCTTNFFVFKERSW